MIVKNAIVRKSLYLLIPLALIALVIIKLKSNKEIASEKIYHYNKEQSIPVQADTLYSEPLNAETIFTGTFEPDKESKISAEIQGKINEVLVDAGTVVHKGQKLVQLDHSFFRLQLQAAEVQIEGLQADVNRYTILAGGDAIQGVQLEKAELALKSANIQKATLLEQINKTTIRAPFNGIVTAKFIDEGAFAAPGFPLIQLTDITSLKFTVNITEKDLSQFRLNQVYSITADAYPGLLLKGQLSMIGSKANIGNNFPLQFSVNNTSDLKIKSGMFGKVLIKNMSDEKGIMIPLSAIIGTADRPQIYLVKNGKSVLHDIAISRIINNSAVVIKGVNEGDVIITKGFINLFNGANVDVNNNSVK